MTPWRQAPDLFLQVRDITPNISSASALGIGRIRDLPPEILRIVHEHSSTSPFWRYSAASDLAQALCSIPPNDLSVPLLRVRAWERGCCPEVEEIADRLHAMRLTIDSYGIRRIERLAGSLRYQQRRTNHLAFVILEADKMQDVTAHFKVCSRLLITKLGATLFSHTFKFRYARLDVPAACGDDFRIWDTPSPPSLEQCLLWPSEIGPSMRFCTIELHQTFGITFFVHSGDIYAAHAHTPRGSSAKASCSRLSRRRQQSAAWVYVPVSASDSVAAFGVGKAGARGSFCLLVSLNLFCLWAALDV